MAHSSAFCAIEWGCRCCRHMGMRPVLPDVTECCAFGVNDPRLKPCCSQQLSFPAATLWERSAASKTRLNMPTIISSKLCWPQITVFVGIRVLRIVRRVVEVLGALELRALGSLIGSARSYQSCQCQLYRGTFSRVSVFRRRRRSGTRIFAAHVHVRMQAEQRHVLRHRVGCIHAEVRVARRNLERRVAGRERHGALAGGSLAKHQAQPRLVRRGLALRHVVDLEHDVRAGGNQLRLAGLEHVRAAGRARSR